MSRFTSVKEILELFSSKGSTIQAIIEDGEEIPFDRVLRTKDRIKWTCANNSDHISTSKLETVIDRTGDKYLCRACSISESKGGGYEKFVKLLKGEGWKMSSPKKEYKNTKSIISVICPKGHEIKLSQNRFSSGHKCKFCNRDATKKDINVIREEFELRGYRLISEAYENNKAPLQYECKCGRITDIEYHNFVRNIDGCIKCTRHMLRDHVEDIMEEAGCKLVCIDDDPYAKTAVKKSKITYVCFCGSIGTSMFKSFINGSRCKTCNLIFMRDQCIAKYGVVNQFQREEVKQKIRETNMKMFGVNYVMQNGKFVQRAKETNIKNNGGVHNLNLPETRIKATVAFEEKYGASFGNVPEMKEKAKSTNLERYGSEYPLQSKQVQDTTKKNNLEKYGNEVFLASEAGKALMVEKYGVPYAAQNKDIFSKMKRNSYLTKQYAMPSGQEVDIQGYEHFALNDLIDLGVGEEDIKIGVNEIPSIGYKFGGKSCVYHPDIYIESLDLLIEIKSMYTYKKDYAKNIAKFQAASELHNFQLWVYSSKGERIMQRQFVTAELNFIDA